MEKMFAVFARYNTGYSGHDDEKKLVLVWATNQDEALAQVKRDFEGHTGGWYDYEVTEVDLTPGGEPQTVYYWDNR